MIIVVMDPTDYAAAYDAKFKKALRQQAAMHALQTAVLEKCLKKPDSQTEECLAQETKLLGGWIERANTLP